MRSTFPTGKVRRRPPEDGIALLAVMWGVTLLVLIALMFSSSVQIETRSVIYQKEAAQAYGIACGGVEAAMFEMAYPPKSDSENAQLWTWRAGQLRTVVRFRGGAAELEIQNEAGKLDLNAASKDRLARLFAARDLRPVAANDLAAAIVHWRTPAAGDEQSSALDDYYERRGYRARHAPFGSVEEVLRVRGMTRDLFYGTLEVTREGRVRPVYGVGDDLTVFSKAPAVNINYASRTVLESVPGMTPELATAIVQERTRQPFESMAEAGQRLVDSLPGASLPYLSTNNVGVYSIVSVGVVAGSRVRRAVKALVYMQGGGGQPRIVGWYDEYLRNQGIG